MFETVRRRARLALTIAVMALAPAAGRAETLADTLILAYRNSNLLDQNQAVLRAADEDAAAALASLRPVLNFVAQSGYNKSAQLDGFANSATLSAQVTILDFGRGRLGLDIARESVLATREALLSVEQDVLLQAVIAFMDVKAAEQNVEINRNSVRVIGEALRAAQDRFDLGEVTRTDVALAESRLAAARAGYAAAQGQLAVAREAYRAATGVYPGALSGAPRSPALPASLEEAKAIAQRNHPLIRQAERQVTIAELSVKLAEAQRMPTIDLGASVSSDLENDPTGQVGLSLNQTIYAGGAIASAARKAIAQRDAARSGLLQTSVQIAQQVGEAWANIAVTRAQLEAIDRQIEAALAAYEGTKEEAALGARTTLDVLNAEQDLLDARASRITTEAGLQKGIYSLLSAMGLLTVDHLGLGIPTYDPAAYYNAVKDAPATSAQGDSLDRVLRAIGKD